MTKKSIEKWYSIILPLFPMLILYGFEILPFLTFSDYLLLFFVMAEIIKREYRLVYDKAFVPLIIYLVVQPILLLLFASDQLDFIDAAGTAWKLALYIFGIAILKKNLQKEYFVKTVRFIGVSSTVYGFLQFFLGTYAHISLSPYLPFLPVLRTGLKEQQDSWIAYNWTVRPRAWFSEPSTFAIFLLMALLVELFVVYRDKRKNVLCLIYVFGIVISHSSTGAFGLIILLLAWMLIYPQDFLYRLPKKIIIVMLLLLPLCAFLLYKSGYVDSFIGHTFVNGQGLSSQSHFIDIQAAMSEGTNVLQFLFGHGMQDVKAGYLPGWIRTYYCLGTIGVLLYAVGFYRVCRRCSRRARIIVLAFIGLNFGTEIMLGVFMLLYMSAALLQDDSCEDERNEHSARCIDIKNAAL